MATAEEEDLLTVARMGGSAFTGERVRQLLLVSGAASVDAKDATGWSPLHWAVRHAALSAIEALCTAGANVDAEDGFRTTPLHLAARDGRVAEASMLLKHGSSRNARDEDGLTPLMHCSRGGFTDVVKELAAPAVHATEGVEVERPSLRLEEQCNAGLTALLWACTRAQPAAVAALLQLGADVEARDPAGRTCLILASELGLADVVEALLQGGASLAALSADGTSAVIAASREGRAEAMLVLVRHGAAVSAVDASGRSALGLATRKVVNSLLEADPSKLFGRRGERVDHWKVFQVALGAYTGLGRFTGVTHHAL